MIPEERLSTAPVRGRFLNPWSRQPASSYSRGPVFVADASQGLNARMWALTAFENTLILSSSGVEPSILITRPGNITECSLAWDQNARPAASFVEGGRSYLYWYDPVIQGFTVVTLAVDVINPRVTLDDSRPEFIGISDIILAYVRSGLLWYRQQRDRYTIEYPLRIGESGQQAAASELQHIGMNSVNRLQFLIDGASDENWSLAEIIEDVAVRARVPAERLQFQSSMYETIVPGCATSPDYSTDEFIAMLGRVYFFDQQEADGQIRYMFRGGPSVATIDEMDMVEGEDEVEEDTTRDSIQVPQLMHMMYMDTAGGLSADKQQSDRPLGERAEAPVVVSTPVVLSAQSAARAIRITHKVIEDQLRGTLKFGVPDSFLHVTRADPVVVTYRGRSVRGRVIEETIEDGWQRLEVERERQSAYTADVQPVPPAPVTTPRPSIPGPTVAEFMNLPALVPANDALGYHFAVSGVIPSWRGAVVERERAGEFSIIATDSSGTVMATLLDPLPSASEHYVDSTNVIRVSLVRDDDQFDSVTDVQLLSGLNAAAIIRPDGTGEVVQFRDAEEVEPGVWELSYLLRGRLNSKATGHDEGARLVMLGGSMFFPAGVERIGQEVTHLVYSYPELPSTGTTLVDTFAPPLSQYEWPPVITSATEDSGSVAVAWIPRHRFGRDTAPFPSVNFDGWRVEVTDGASTVTAETTTTQATIDASSLTPPLTARVAGLNRITGPGEWAELEVT